MLGGRYFDDFAGRRRRWNSLTDLSQVADVQLDGFANWSVMQLVKPSALVRLALDRAEGLTRTVMNGQHVNLAGTDDSVNDPIRTHHNLADLWIAELRHRTPRVREIL